MTALAAPKAAKPRAKILTAAAVVALKPGPSVREIPDGKIAGLYLQIWPSNKRSWCLRYRVAGRPTKLTIGADLTLAQARKLAEQARGSIAQGRDPAGERRAAKEAEAGSVADLTLAEGFGRFSSQHLATHVGKRWRDEAQRIFKAYFLPALGRRKLVDVTRADVRAIVDSVAEHAPIMANRCFALIRKFGNWAVEKDLIEAAPWATLKPPAKTRSRDRVLSDDEIATVWRAAESLRSRWTAFVQLLILLGARRGEIGGMTWSEIDFAERVWRLPRERSKNHNEHLVPLPDAAIEILRDVRRIPDSRFVFSTTGAVPLGSFSKSKRLLDDAITKLRGEPLPSWTYHDLRRTLATNLQRLNVRLEVTEAVLGHVSGSRSGIVGVYQRHNWADEKRGALSAWANRLRAILDGGEAPSNVVQLAAKA
jgi:integrase